MHLPLLCILLFVVGSQAEASVYFNNSVDCSSGCSLPNPNIYEGFLLPTVNDQVYFNVTNQTYSFTLPPNTTFIVSSFSIWNTFLAVNSGSSLNASESYFYNVIINQYPASTISAEELSLEYSTVFTNGYIHASDFSAEYTFFSALIGTVLESGDFEMEGGTVEFHEGSSFNSSDASFEDVQITFYIVPDFGEEADFERVTAVLPFGFIVREEFTIYSSNITAYFPNALANVSLVLAGTNNLNISNIAFNPDKIRFNQTTSPYVTFQVSNNASFNGNLTVPGQIIVNSGSNVHFSGNISLTGGIQADVSGATQIDATGILRSDAPITLTGHPDDNNTFVSSYSFSVASASLITPAGLTLDHFILRSNEGTTVIWGPVINNGSVHIFEGSNLIIQGNYTQFPNTTFGVYNLAPTANRSTNLYVNGSAHLDGNLKYNASETTNAFTATIVESSEVLIGNFSTSNLINGDVSELSPKLIFRPHTIDININPKKTPSWLGLHWWIWVIIGGGAFAVIVIAIVVVVMRRRASYEPVRNSGY